MVFLDGGETVINKGKRYVGVIALFANGDSPLGACLWVFGVAYVDLNVLEIVVELRFCHATCDVIGTFGVAGICASFESKFTISDLAEQFLGLRFYPW